MKLEQYSLRDEIIQLSNDSSVGFQEATDEVDGKDYELLRIQKNEVNTAIIERIIRNIKPLIDTTIMGVQRVEYINEETQNYFIVYEALEISEGEFNKTDFLQCIKTLGELKKDNRDGFIINKQTVIKTPGGIKIRFVGLFELFKKSIFSIAEDTAEKRNINNDIKNLALLFADYLNVSEEGKGVYSKCINGEYKKYFELEQDAANLPFTPNPNFSNIQITTDAKKINTDELVDEFNQGCYWIVQEEKSSKKNEVTIEWSTEKYSGKAFVNAEDISGGVHYDYLFVPHKNDQPNSKVLEKGERAPFNFKKFDGNKCSSIDYFFKKHEEVNELANLHETKNNSLKIWKALPEVEKAYIEKNAFKASYTERKKSKNNDENIIFYLNDVFKDWGAIKQKKSEGVVLFIDGTAIGEILNYNPKEKELTIKDYRGDIDAIPSSGTLIEDVQQMTSQYKKQVEACEKLGKRDIVNPELAAFIATPEVLTNLPHINIDYDEFEIFDGKLGEYETQKNAVIEALHRKPIFLIQGPPGTGKTTVIVELVQQYIKQNKNSKILVVSQSNMAVDNVLERLLPKDILFMRLASGHAIEGDNIIPVIQEHLFEKKLKTWIGETTERSKNFLEEKFPQVDPMILKLYHEFVIRKVNNFMSFKKIWRGQGVTVGYYERLFEKAQTIDDIKKIFLKTLEEKYIKLYEIHKSWIAFINNSTSQKNNKNISTLKEGSNDIELQTAFAKSMNVFGATCIHIASAKYSKFNLKFDYMIMDEASKATFAEALVPINMSKNLILIGDHKQLPPVVTREEAVKAKIKKELDDEGLDVDKTYGVSLFETLFNEFEKSNQLGVNQIMLDIQYRMPRQLGYLISKYIYQGKLKNPNIEKLTEYDRDKKHHLPLKRKMIEVTEDETEHQLINSIVFISTSKRDKPSDNDNKYKRCNDCNVEVIQETLSQLYQLYEVKQIPTPIGIIAAYRGQVENLKNKIKKKQYKNFAIDINTVDKFQGSERDIIIYDVVKSSKNESSIGFLDDYRRINVAFSRARKLLIVVGDSDYLLNRAMPNPHSEVKKEELVIKNITKELSDWGCIYNSLEEALENE